MLKGKKILVGVTASIAAYKAALLIRLLIKKGAEVKVIMTTSAFDFITPLTLSTLSKNPVLSDFIKDKTGEWNNHVELGLWADLFVIAPATANTLAKAAHGICDNLLMATYLSARCQVVWAPAMDLDMYQHQSTKNNLSLIKSAGDIIIDAEDGELASGLEGKGRMAEPENIISFLEEKLGPNTNEFLEGKRVLITAGPTNEYIDPVRFMTNASTGKMGYAIAAEFVKMGCEVNLVSGPSNQPIPEGVNFISVSSAHDMYEAVQSRIKNSDINVFSAAVADYTPVVSSDIKIKKSGDFLDIKLKKTKDIAFEMGKLKTQNQVSVGFALETNNELENAQGKLEKKNLDMIVLNSLKDKGAGFGHDTNVITIIDKKEKIEYPLKSKKEVAKDIVNHVINLVRNK